MKPFVLKNKFVYMPWKISQKRFSESQIQTKNTLSDYYAGAFLHPL